MISAFCSLLMNSYRNIAWVSGMKIFSFNHNSLDFVAVLFCYVFSHCGGCKSIWRLFSYFMFEVFLVFYILAWLTPISHQKNTSQWSKNYVWPIWYTEDTPLLVSLHFPISLCSKCCFKEKYPHILQFYVKLKQVGSHLVHSSWSIAPH